jgi:AcrR family transcriptional regulator
MIEPRGAMAPTTRSRPVEPSEADVEPSKADVEPSEAHAVGARADSEIRQRQRLMAAMIDVVGRQGSRATTVKDVVGAAGMSRKTFYRHFANKQDCLLQTADLVIDVSIAEVEKAYLGVERWPDRVGAALRALFALANDNPGSVRLSLVEVGAAGPAGLQRRERWFGEFERFIVEAIKLAPQPGEPSKLVVEAVVGGVAGVLTRRLVPHGRRVRLTPLVTDLVAWITAYHPVPPAILAEPRSAAGGTPAPLLGGRAPGTLLRQGPLRLRRGLPRGEANPSRSFVVHSQRERILDAVTLLTAEHGYAAVNVEGIAEQAAISLQAFYEHFANKDDAFIVAYEVGHAKCLSFVEAAYAAESDWREGVRAAISALFCFLASEPAFARIALVDVLTATPRTAERSSLALSAFAQLLAPGLAAPPKRPSDVTVDAITGGVFELCLRCAMRDELSELPQLAPIATYFALAPFIGGEGAAAVATSKR